MQNKRMYICQSVYTGKNIILISYFRNIQCRHITDLSQTNMSYPISAYCEVGPKGKPCHGGEEQYKDCHGLVKFLQKSADLTQITWDLKNCGKEGLHGFHIHEKADFSEGCKSAGPHFNPFNKNHGAPTDEDRHVGDMGNVWVDNNGNSKGVLYDHLIKLEGPHTVVGRSVMVHEDPDDLGRGDHSKPGVNGFTSKTTGNAGARIACGEIFLGEKA